MPEDIQVIGWIGSRLAAGLEKVFGEGAVLSAFLLLAWSIHLGVYKQTWSSRMWGFSLLFVCFLIYYGLYDIPSGLTPLVSRSEGFGRRPFRRGNSPPVRPVGWTSRRGNFLNFGYMYFFADDY